MPFWNKDSVDEQKRREREAATLKALADGQVPPVARERIERQQAMGKNFFTSDLTSREYLLCRQSGFQTVGQVMGTSFFNVSFFGYYQGRWSGSGELENITHAQSEARRLAVSRMQHEATLLGASGVIGVRILIKSHDWSSRQTEFTAIGTAVKIPGYPEGATPFTSDLNGQDFWNLYQAGYRPLGLAFGVCSYYIYTDSNTQSLVGNRFFGLNLAPNQEVRTYTQGFYEARERAMNRFTNDIAAHKGCGVVAVDANYRIQDIEYEVNNYTYHDMLIHWVVMGTVISQKEEKLDKLPQPLFIYNLANKSRSGVSIDTIYDDNNDGGGFGDDLDD